MDCKVEKALLRLEKMLLENGDDTRNLVEAADEFEQNGPKLLRDMVDAIERKAGDIRSLVEIPAEYEQFGPKGLRDMADAIELRRERNRKYEH
jgi:hypothetical protein